MREHPFTKLLYNLILGLVGFCVLRSRCYIINFKKYYTIRQHRTKLKFSFKHTKGFFNKINIITIIYILFFNFVS